MVYLSLVLLSWVRQQAYREVWPGWLLLFRYICDSNVYPLCCSISCTSSRCSTRFTHGIIPPGVYINGAGACTSISCPIFFPKLLETLPKPGSWMETFKQFMAFPLYGTIMFLLWTLAGQVGEWKLLTILLMMVIVALSCWIYGHWPRKRLAKVVSVFLLVSAATWALPDAPTAIPSESIGKMRTLLQAASGRSIWQSNNHSFKKEVQFSNYTI